MAYSDLQGNPTSGADSDGSFNLRLVAKKKRLRAEVFRERWAKWLIKNGLN